MSESYDAAWATFMAEAGPLLAEALSEEAPVGDPDTDPDSGTLAASMSYKVDSGVLQIVSEDPRGPIAAYVTRGTRPHGIDPVNANMLHWIGSSGEDVYALHVDHPGTQPNEFHLRAWENQRDTVVRMYRDIVGAGSLALLNPWRNKTIDL